MDFLNRTLELKRLTRLTREKEGGLAVIYGRRRVGKTRLLLEWAGKQGIYAVADQSAAAVQRRYFAEAVAARIPGFAEVDYPDWRSLLRRLAADAKARSYRGPIVLDELPYLVLSAPELPSVLQQWIDHDAREARLVVAVAGSSQRMMQGLLLAPDAPLYGRAREVLEVRPMGARDLGRALRLRDPFAVVEAYSAWGGVPRYWELAAGEHGSTRRRVEQIVLDPLGPLHREPDRLLLEEVPSAMEVRAVLDAIGGGAHRLSEIASRLGRPATSLSRPVERLVGMGLARREVPFGESEKSSRKSLYRIDDPFFRLWFRVVAGNRAGLANALPAARSILLGKHWDGLVAAAWEELCRARLSGLPPEALGIRTNWGPASRWWRGNLPEWDVVSASTDGRWLLLGECKSSRRPLAARDLERIAAAVAARPAPAIAGTHQVIRVLFGANVDSITVRSRSGVRIVSAKDVLADGS